MAEDAQIPAHLYERLDKVLEVATRCAALLEAQATDIKDLKTEGEQRWRDHETRMRILEISYMRAEDIQKLTSGIEHRVTIIESDLKSNTAVKQGITKSYAAVWAVGVAVASMLIPAVNFFANHLEKLAGLIK